LKSLILCFSYHHNNTEKVAKQIAGVLSAEIKSPLNFSSSGIVGYDLIGLGSGIYFGKHHKTLLELADKLPSTAGQKVFIFSTSGQPNNSAKFHKKLKQKLGMAMILITHDMGVVAEVADRITVLYAGRVCESASTKTIFNNPMHPYTRALLEAVPNLALKREKLKVIPGVIPNLIDPPSGCRFHPRCEFAKEGVCTREMPSVEELEPGHYVACERVREIIAESPLRTESK
jgi:oligopeptide/dipeptide ABC transporter ATP-binding protein